MSTAADTVEALIKLGELIASAIAGKKVDWATFLQGQDFKTISASVQQLLTGLDQRSLNAVIATISQKQQQLLGTRKLQNLSSDELRQYSSLGRLKLVLSAQEANASNLSVFGDWLLNKGLPVLLEIAPVVIPLLL